MQKIEKSKSKVLRDYINDPQILIMPGIFDGYSSRLIEHCNFQAGFITGGGLSESRLGWADVGLMGYEENIQACRNMAACSNLPLLADADTGYGNAVNVFFTVQGFERAGLAGLMIEDQVWPKRCGHLAGKQVISAEEATEKIISAAEARDDPDFVIMARTDTFAVNGIDDVIKRLNLFGEGGADLLFADALLDIEDIKTVVNNVSKPVCVNMGFGIRRRSTTPLLTAPQLQELGVAVVIYPRLLTASALQGMQNAINALKDSSASFTPTDRPELMFSFEELNSLMGIATLNDIEKRFVTSRF